MQPRTVHVPGDDFDFTQQNDKKKVSSLEMCDVIVKDLHLLVKKLLAQQPLSVTNAKRMAFLSKLSSGKN